MLDFAYHLTIGNLDEAFKAIKLIKRFLIRISLCTFIKISRYAVGLRNIIIGNSPIIIRSVYQKYHDNLSISYSGCSNSTHITTGLSIVKPFHFQ